MTLGDIRAKLSACKTGEKGLLKLVDRYGPEVLDRYYEELLDLTERVVRAEIRSWPDGEYVFEDYLDNDGVDAGTIPLKVKLSVRGDCLEIDFYREQPTGEGRHQLALPLHRLLLRVRGALHDAGRHSQHLGLLPPPGGHCPGGLHPEPGHAGGFQHAGSGGLPPVGRAVRRPGPGPARPGAGRGRGRQLPDPDRRLQQPAGTLRHVRPGGGDLGGPPHQGRQRRPDQSRGRHLQHPGRVDGAGIPGAAWNSTRWPPTAAGPAATAAAWQWFGTGATWGRNRPT